MTLSLTLGLSPCLQATREARREAQETEKRRKSTLPDNMPGMRKGSLTDSRAPPPCTPCTRTASAEQNQTRARVRRQGGLEGVGEGCYRAQRRLTLRCVLRCAEASMRRTQAPSHRRRSLQTSSSPPMDRPPMHRPMDAASSSPSTNPSTNLSTNLGALELRSPMRRSTTWADPAAPRADPAALHSISSTSPRGRSTDHRLSVGCESDREGAGGEEAEEAGGESLDMHLNGKAARDGGGGGADSALPPSAHDLEAGEVVEVRPTPKLSFSSPKDSPKGSPSQGRALPHVSRVSHEGVRERADDELRGGGGGA